MTGRDRDEFARGFVVGWCDAQEANRRRARRWAELWLAGDHRNDQACPVCLALLDEPARLGATT